MLDSIKKVVVTGGAGTCGSRIVRALLAIDHIEEVVSLDFDEGSLFSQMQEYRALYGFRYQSVMVDIRDLDDLRRVFRGAQAVIHCAAYKNVPVCETSPTACISVNIDGTSNVIKAAIDTSVDKVLFTSSDKAVNPTNVMGATKLVGERLIVAANIGSNGSSDTKFSATRFGNVVGSTGSVLPVFVNQLTNGDRLTITDLEMSRFMMSQHNAATLVLESLDMMQGGEIFITKMPVLKLREFSEAIFQLYNRTLGRERAFTPESYQIIGVRAGEKMYEELMTDEERPRSIEKDKFFVVLPSHFDLYSKLFADIGGSDRHPDRTYNSHEESSLTSEQAIACLEEWLEKDQVALTDLA